MTGNRQQASRSIVKLTATALLSSCSVLLKMTNTYDAMRCRRSASSRIVLCDDTCMSWHRIPTTSSRMRHATTGTVIISVTEWDEAVYNSWRSQRMIDLSASKITLIRYCRWTNAEALRWQAGLDNITEPSARQAEYNATLDLLLSCWQNSKCFMVNRSLPLLVLYLTFYKTP